MHLVLDRIDDSKIGAAVAAGPETVLDLIEADPMSGKTTAPLLTDADWLRLQAICEG